MIQAGDDTGMDQSINNGVVSNRWIFSLFFFFLLRKASTERESKHGGGGVEEEAEREDLKQVPHPGGDVGDAVNLSI